MRLATRVSLMHAIGTALTLGAVFAGYRYAYVPASESRALATQLRARLAQCRAEIDSRPTRAEPEVVVADVAPVVERPIPRGIRPMTPTAFLSAFEDHARMIGLRVEGSKELDDTGASGATTGGGKLVELNGTGTFAAVLEFFDRVHEPLPGMEIRRLRLTRGPDDQVRWTMVCMNHDGLAGGG